MKLVDQRVMSNSQTRMLISGRYIIWSVWWAVHIHTDTCEMVTSITLILMRSVLLCSFSTLEFLMFVHVFWDDKSVVWLHAEEFCFIFAKLYIKISFVSNVSMMAKLALEEFICKLNYICAYMCLVKYTKQIYYSRIIQQKYLKWPDLSLIGVW